MSSNLLLLAQYLSGEFENREQAAADPVWYVALRLWQRPVQLFSGDSVTLFAEQANLIYLDRPYRQRLMRLQRSSSNPTALQVQYYGFRNPAQFKGAGEQPELLAGLTEDQVEWLSGCVLNVEVRSQPTGLRFVATALPGNRCQFYYDGKVGEVVLGFEICREEYLTFDKGIDPATGQALWGALMGPYRYQKQQEYLIRE